MCVALAIENAHLSSLTPLFHYDYDPINYLVGSKGLWQYFPQLNG